MFDRAKMIRDLLEQAETKPLNFQSAYKISLERYTDERLREHYEKWIDKIEDEEESNL